jgi:hypothetical protein
VIADSPLPRRDRRRGPAGSFAAASLLRFADSTADADVRVDMLEMPPTPWGIAPCSPLGKRSCLDASRRRSCPTLIAERAISEAINAGWQIFSSPGTSHDQCEPLPGVATSPGTCRGIGYSGSPAGSPSATCGASRVRAKIPEIFANPLVAQGSVARESCFRTTGVV